WEKSSGSKATSPTPPDIGMKSTVPWTAFTSNRPPSKKDFSSSSARISTKQPCRSLFSRGRKNNRCRKTAPARKGGAAFLFNSVKFFDIIQHILPRPFIGPWRLHLQRHQGCTVEKSLFDILGLSGGNIAGKGGVSPS